MLSIITATEKDIPVIEDILSDAVRYLDSIGKPLWLEDEVKWARLSKSFRPSDFLIALLDGIPAACMAVVDHDPFLWPDIPKGQSLFIHKLAVKRFAAGKGLSDALISHAKQMCADGGIPALRLDCHSLMPKLRAVYERNGFVCVAEKIMFGKYHTTFYEYEINDTKHLFHYFEKGKPPFQTLTVLPFEKAVEVLRAIQYNDLTDNANIEQFMKRRYEMEKTIRDKFISIGGKPVRAAPVYCTLGENEGMKTWFNDPAWIKIPVNEIDLDTVSFTYGDSFAVFNPSLNTGEEWWCKVYHYDKIIKLIEKYGYPEDTVYDIKNNIFPQDKPIHHYLKYIEAHVWCDKVLEKYI